MRSHKSPQPAEPVPSPSDDMPYEARRAAFIEAEVERAARPFERLFPADVLDAFRERTALHLTTDPAMIRLIDAALPRPDHQHSAVLPAAGSPAAPAAREEANASPEQARRKRRAKP